MAGEQRGGRLYVHGVFLDVAYSGRRVDYHFVDAHMQGDTIAEWSALYQWLPKRPTLL